MNKQDYLDRVTDSRQKVAESPTKDNIRWLASSLGSLGNYIASEESNYSEAISLHKESKDINHSIGEFDGEAQACFNIGAIYEVGLHDEEGAYNYLKQGMALVLNERIKGKYQPELRRLELLGRIDGWLENENINSVVLAEPKKEKPKEIDITKWKNKYPSLNQDGKGNSLCPECALPFKSEKETYIHIEGWHSK